MIILNANEIYGHDEREQSASVRTQKIRMNHFVFDKLEWKELLRFPGFVKNKKYDEGNHTNDAYDDIRPAEKRIFSTHPWSRTNNKLFTTREARHRIILIEHFFNKKNTVL